MHDEIARAIKNAARDGNKTATFHLQVLLHARELGGVDPVEFCRAVGMPDSFSTEFRKMMNVAKLMRERGQEIR